MNTEFNKWWNEDLLTEDNPFVDGTAAYWAWEGWCAGIKAEREACAQLCAEDASGRDSGGYYAEIIRDRSTT